MTIRQRGISTLTARGTIGLVVVLIAGLSTAAGHAGTPKYRRLASTVPTYNPAEAQISGNGRYVVFSARLGPAPNKGATVQNDKSDAFPQQIFRFDLVTGLQELISKKFGSSEPASGGNALSPSISDDGRLIVFASASPDLVPGDTNNTRDVFLYDAVTRKMSRLSLDQRNKQMFPSSTAAPLGDFVGDYPTISGDGSTVAFLSDANLLHEPGIDVNETTGLYIRSLRTGRLSSLTNRHGHTVRSGTHGNDVAYERTQTELTLPPFTRPALSRTGDVLAFGLRYLGRSGDLYDPDLSSSRPHGTDGEVYVRSMRSGVTKVVSDLVPPAGSRLYNNGVGLDATGRRVVYTASTVSLGVPMVVASNVVVHDTKNGSDEMAACRPTDVWFEAGMLSADGRYLAFSAQGTATPRSNLLLPSVRRSQPETACRVMLHSGSDGLPTGALITAVTSPESDTFRVVRLSSDGQVMSFITSAPLDASDNSTAGGPTGDREDVYVLR